MAACQICLKEFIQCLWGEFYGVMGQRSSLCKIWNKQCLKLEIKKENKKNTIYKEEEKFHSTRKSKKKKKE